MWKGIFFYSLLFPFFIYAQKEDYNWIMGAGQSDLGIHHKLNHFQFKNNTFKVTLLNASNPFFGACAVISDSAGALKCYTNDINLYNSSHLPMPNGKDFQSASKYPYGYPFNQSVVIVPLPGGDSRYIMVDGEQVDIGIDIITKALRYTIINAGGNNGLGEIEQKAVLVANSFDTLNAGFWHPFRHGNGKDWWLLATKFESNRYRKFLINENGIAYHDDQPVGPPVHNGIGYAAFSPSGCWYAHYVAYGQTSAPKSALYLYRFDRGTGQLSIPLFKPYADDAVYGGAAFSPNSRYLYVARMLAIYQYDLYAPDILASETVVAEYDGFLDENGVPTRFYGLQLAPDNKIYGNIPGFNSRYLHVIDQPDQPGAACTVIQHAIYLPAHNFGTLPNLPCFRPGPSGIACDSLISPVPQPPDTGPGSIHVWPVPAADVLYFSADGTSEAPMKLVLFDAYGRPALVREDLPLAPVATVSLEDLPPGVYFYTLYSRGGKPAQSGKVIRTR